MLTRRLLILSMAAWACPAIARPTRYVLDPDRSRVGFTYRLSGALQQGEMPISRATLMVDPDNLSASTADVIVTPAGARTGFFFATEALKSASVLNTDAYPDIRFVSTAVRLAPSGRLSDGAALIGNLTVRDKTQQISLDTSLYRQPGTAPNDLRVLTVRLAGEISRSSFGATGYSDLVDDPVGLDIRATIRAVD